MARIAVESRSSALLASPIGHGALRRLSKRETPPHHPKSCRHHERDPMATSQAGLFRQSQQPALANCELGQIQQSFSAAAELYPTHQGVPLAS